MTAQKASPHAAVADAVEGQQCVGVAVSGGSDSMALLLLAQQAAVDTGCRIAAVTVDHGLRKDSASEAATVAEYCAKNNISHRTLRWARDDPRGNLQAAARTARYALMAEWAEEQGISTILLGHTLDDQAETFLMRLGREAGLDGLSGMAQRIQRNGIVWSRPLLGTTRAALRDMLLENGVTWSDDPSNEDTRFDRVKARQAMAALAPLGIDAQGLGRVMLQLDDARVALHHVVQDAAALAIRQEEGDLILDWTALATHPFDIRRRCLVAALMWVGGAGYPPRREDVMHLIRSLSEEGQKTLSGCILRRKGHDLRVTREYQAVRDLDTATDAVWDRRWRIDGPHDGGLRLRALGEAGLALCPDWRDTGLPRVSLLSSPAVWAQERLVAAPVAGLGQEWAARIVADFHDRPVSH